MTHHIPGAGVQPVPATTVSRPSLTGPPITTGPSTRLSREAIRLGIALRHESLAELEDEMVAACEAAAATAGSRCLNADDRSRWDRATWDRYLDAATRLEAGYGPRMRRLRDDIARLERLLELPIAA